MSECARGTITVWHSGTARVERATLCFSNLLPLSLFLCVCIFLAVLWHPENRREKPRFMEREEPGPGLQPPQGWTNTFQSVFSSPLVGGEVTPSWKSSRLPFAASPMASLSFNSEKVESLAARIEIHKEGVLGGN